MIIINAGNNVPDGHGPEAEVYGQPEGGLQHGRDSHWKPGGKNQQRLDYMGPCVYGVIKLLKHG